MTDMLRILIWFFIGLDCIIFTILCTSAYYESHPIISYVYVNQTQTRFVYDTSCMGVDPRIKEMVNLTNNFAESHVYTNEYDCDNYSEDYSTMMRKHNFSVNIERGCSEDENGVYCHTWNTLTLHIEPQQGDFWSNNDQEYNDSRWECGTFGNRTGCRKQIR